VTCTSALPWDRKAFGIGREDITEESILVFFVLSLYLDRIERDDEEETTERERETERARIS
jgi:hypothetical protein